MENKGEIHCEDFFVHQEHFFFQKKKGSSYAGAHDMIATELTWLAIEKVSKWD
jgi:hypothetical protein